MLKIKRTPDGAAIVLTVSGRLDAGNVSELCASLDAIPAGTAVVLDLADLVLADRDVVRLLKAFEFRDGVAIRNCPAYIRIWMAAEDIR
jgi:anti-anti-sigma regulatory factor